MRGSIALLAAHNGGENLLCDHLSFRCQGDFSFAYVAGSAAILLRVVFLTEVLDELAMSTHATRSKIHHFAEAIESCLRSVRVRVLASFLSFSRGAFDEIFPAVIVGPGVQEHALGGQTITTRPACLLAILLDALGQRSMNDEAHVGSVDAHAESNGGDDDVDVFSLEGLLHSPPFVGRQTRVVGGAAQSEMSQAVVQTFHFFAGDAVDDARFVFVSIDDLDQLGIDIASWHDAVAEVRAITVANEEARFSQAELLDDIIADFLGRCRGEGVHRNVRGKTTQLSKLSILGAKVVAPVTDAMRLVDRDCAKTSSAKSRKESITAQSLRRDEEKLQLPGFQVGIHGLNFRTRLDAREHCSGDTVLEQAVDLILHQRDEWANDQGQAFAIQRGRLIAEALTASCGKYEQQILISEHGAHGTALIFAQRERFPRCERPIQVGPRGRLGAVS